MKIGKDLYEFVIKVVDERVSEIKVTRGDFDELTGVVRNLALRTTELAEAQARTEKRVEELAKRVEELAEAQARTEKRVEELAEAQTRTEKRVEELAEAQKKTEIALRDLAVQVGRLSDTIGYGLEDVAKVVLPGYLERHLGIKVEELDRRFIPLRKDLIEVNLYGEGYVDGEQVVVLGEVKSRIYKSEVNAFLQEINRIVGQFAGKRIVKVLFGYLVHPSAEDIARENDILLVSSYQR